MEYLLAVPVPVFIAGLFAALLLFIEAGRRLGRLQIARRAEKESRGLGVIEGAVFGLMGLLIAFTFAGAASRFDDRRHLIVEEANAIGTAYLRLDVLPPAAQPALREDFKRYVDLRLAAYRKLPDVQAAKAELALCAPLQERIWTAAVAAAAQLQGPQGSMLLLPALNAMIDITTTRTFAGEIHPPWIIYAVLLVVALTCALLAGYGMAGREKRNWMHMLGFAAILSTTLYVIVDLEYPRLGLIRVDAADHLLADLRQSWK